MLRESIRMSWSNIINNKMRSFLTTLGIVIGVTSIIALITIVQGATGEITSQFEDMGAGKVTVTAPGSALKKGLNDGDIHSLEKITNVGGVSPTLSVYSSVVRDSMLEENVTIEGKNQVHFQYNKDLIARGRALNIYDLESKNKVCVINHNLEEILFLGEDPLNQNLQIGGTTFTVVGILNDDSDLMAAFSARAGGNLSDGKAIVPYKTAMAMSGVGSTNSVDIFLQDPNASKETIIAIEANLDQAFNYKEDSYSVINMDSLVDTMKTMTAMMTGLLGGIASISLLVGGIGIMNMMLVSVTERTTEIGLRKALGADPLRIQIQFLVEAIFLSLIGGFIGLILGVFVSWIASSVLGIAFTLSIGAIVLGVGFSASVGIIFGWAPARNASRLNPIDALRSA